MAQCSAVKAKSGLPCPNPATGDDGLCTGHRASAKRWAGKAEKVKLAQMPRDDAVELVAALSTVKVDVALDPLDVVLSSELAPGSVVTLTITAEAGDPILYQTQSANVVRVRLRPVAVLFKREEATAPPEDEETTAESLARWERRMARLRERRTQRDAGGAE